MTKATISAGASTQSRARRPGKRLVTLSHCSGVYEYTTDGRKILSWPMGQYGPLLGYPGDGNQLSYDFLSEMGYVMDDGRASIGSYAPELEQQLADKLAALYAPYLRSPDIGIRFFSNGTDATQCAVALARHATGREAFVSVGYHGGSSPVFTFPPQDKGVLRANGEGRFDCEFGSSDTMALDESEMACLVIEVPAVENELETAKYLNGCFHKYHRGSYVILDDIVTGFRFAPAGALEYYSNLLPKHVFKTQSGEVLRTEHPKIKADFICLGKALSTYGKVSALLGPADIMESLGSEVFASYTFNDHPLGFADALWTLGEYEKHSNRLYKDAGGIITLGNILKDGLNRLFERYNFPAKCIGHPARSSIVPTDDGAKLWELLSRVVDEHDVLLHRPQFVTLAANLDHVDITLRAVESVLGDM